MPSARCFHTLIELPLANYIKCAVDNDLTALIVSGEPSQDELSAAWLDLQAEYADIVGDVKMKAYLACFKKYVHFDTTIAEGELALVMIGRAILHGMTIGKDFHLYSKVVEKRQAFVDIFNTIFNTFLLFNEETFELDTVQARGYISMLELRFEMEGMKLKKLEDDRKKEGGKAPANREYYYDLLITLSDHAKMQLTDSISTFEFAQRIKRFEEYVKSFRNATKGQKTS